MSPRPINTTTKPAQRPGILLTIRFRSKSLEEFIEEYYPDVMHGGMFIRTGTSDPLLKLGARVLLRFEASSGSVLFSGMGLVAWIQGGEERPGVGIQFEDLTERSGLVYQEMLAKRQELRRPRPADAQTEDPRGEFDEAPTLPVGPPPLFVCEG